MVNKLYLLPLLLFSMSFGFSPSLKRDSTIGWCTNVYHYDEFTYRCYPNPLGYFNMSFWWRIPDTSMVNGCLNTLHLPFPNSKAKIEDVPYSPSRWYGPRIPLGGMQGPMVPRISVYMEKNCFDYWSRNGVVPKVKLLTGDSIQFEYKMTSSDTVVADTIRGEINAVYLGVQDHLSGTGFNPYDLFGELVARNSKMAPASANWSHGQILLSKSEPGTVILINLRGQILSTSNRIDGSNTWIVPTGPMAPGVYRLRWSKGQAAVVVPGR